MLVSRTLSEDADKNFIFCGEKSGLQAPLPPVVAEPAAYCTNRNVSSDVVFRAEGFMAVFTMPTKTYTPKPCPKYCPLSPSLTSAIFSILLAYGLAMSVRSTMKRLFLSTVRRTTARYANSTAFGKNLALAKCLRRRLAIAAIWPLWGTFEATLVSIRSSEKRIPES